MGESDTNNVVIESDISPEIGTYYELLAKKAIKSLEKNNIPAEFIAKRTEALSEIVQLIPEGASVGIGDSVTLHQIGLFEWLKEQKFNLYNPFERYSDGELIVKGEKRFELMRKAMVSDYFITGTNAITLDGKLVNIDGHGNRVAPLIFGPGYILVVVGANKIVKNEEEALKRIRRLSAPVNANRHFQKHHLEQLADLPCMHTGSCGICHSKAKICRKITIIDGQSPTFMLPGEKGLRVLIIGESLGI